MISSKPPQLQERTFSVLNLGCKLTQYDAAEVEERLKRLGFRSLEDHRSAEFIILNTCTVTSRADVRARQLIRKMKRENPLSILIVTGCYAQRAPEELARSYGVDYVVGNNQRDELVDIVVNDGLSDRRIIHRPTDEFGPIDMAPIQHFSDHSRAFVKVQDGCRYRCAYCVIPFVRGTARSVPAEQVVAQIENLIDEGYKEVVITGIQLGSYGSDLKSKRSLTDLCRCIIDLPGLKRLRISSLEPWDLEDELIDLVASTDRIASHFHLPVQHGSDHILRKMRRPYTRSMYRTLLEKISLKIDACGIGTDVIVGFPGETGHDFSAMYRFLEELPLTYLHVFRYSKRSGTEAANLRDQIPGNVKKERSDSLRQLSREKNYRFRCGLKGQLVSLITYHSGNGGYVRSLSSNYLDVFLEGESHHWNRFLTAKITRVEEDRTYAIPSQQRAA